MSDSCRLPEFDATQAAALAHDLYTLDGPMKRLHGERDLNFRIDDARGRLVFKIANGEEARDMLDCQHRVFERLAEKQVFPRVACALESVNGQEIEIVQATNGQQHYCRVLPFLEGRIWSEFDISSDTLLHHLGGCLARLDRALEGFKHPGLDRPLLWNMEITGAALDSYKPLLGNAEDLKLVEHFERGYRKRVLPQASALRRGVIHNDANRENVLVDQQGRQVLSVIDFGDMLHTWLVLEPAIAATYAMHGQPDPLASATALVAGYHSELELSEIEIELLFDLIGMRLCMSVCLCAHQMRLQPDNDYLAIDLAETRELLQGLQPVSADAARERFMAACAQVLQLKKDRD